MNWLSRAWNIYQPKDTMLGVESKQLEQDLLAAGQEELAKLVRMMDEDRQHLDAQMFQISLRQRRIIIAWLALLALYAGLAILGIVGHR